MRFNICYLILIVLPLLAADCKDEGPDCHYYITIQNSSNREIVSAIRLEKPNDNTQCLLDGTVLKPGEKYEYRPYNTCIEWGIGSRGGVIYRYIVDAEKFNEEDIYYDCDEIEEHNDILQRYDLTLEDLKKTNFTIVYDDE